MGRGASGRWIWRWWILQCLHGRVAGFDVADFRDLGSMPKETQKVFEVAAKKADALAENSVQKECLADMPSASSWTESKRKQCCEEMGLGCAPPPAVPAKREDGFHELIFRLKERRVPVGEQFDFMIPMSITSDGSVGVSHTAGLETGDPLPEWLYFEPGSLRFEGTPPKVGLFPVKVTAKNMQTGQSMGQLFFDLHVVHQAVMEVDAAMDAIPQPVMRTHVRPRMVNKDTAAPGPVTGPTTVEGAAVGSAAVSPGAGLTGPTSVEGANAAAVPAAPVTAAATGPSSASATGAVAATGPSVTSVVGAVGAVAAAAPSAPSAPTGASATGAAAPVLGAGAVPPVTGPAGAAPVGTGTGTGTGTVPVTGAGTAPTPSTILPQQKPPIYVEFPKVTAMVAKPFVHVLPKTTALSGKTDGAMHFEAVLRGGVPLPKWLDFEHDFDQKSQRNELSFRGTPDKVQTLWLEVAGVAPDGERLTMVTPLEVVPNTPKEEQTQQDQDKDSGGGGGSLKGLPAPDHLQFDDQNLELSGTSTEQKETQKILEAAAKKVEPLAENSLEEDCVSDLSNSPEWPENKRKMCCLQLGVGCIAKRDDGSAKEGLVLNLEERRVTLGEDFDFTLPTSITSAQEGALIHSATLQSGEGLPPWLNFDPASMTFSGVPSAAGLVPVRVTAKNTQGEEIGQMVFDLVVMPRAMMELEKELDEVPQKTLRTHVRPRMVDQNKNVPAVAKPVTLSATTTGAPSPLFVQLPTVTVPKLMPFVHVLPKAMARSGLVDKVKQHNEVHFEAMLRGGQPLPSWLTFNNEFDEQSQKNKLTFRGTAPEVETLQLEVRGVSPQGQKVSLAFPLEVEERGPYVNKVLKDISAKATQPIQERMPQDAILDPDGGAIKYSVTMFDGSALPEWMHFDYDKLEVSGTPMEQQDVTLKVKGTDPQDLSAETTWKVKIGHTRPPLISQHLPDIRGMVGDPIFEKVPEGVVVDPDGSRLNFTAFEDHGPLPDWLKFDPEKMTFSGTPPEPQGLHVYVKGTAEDGLSGHSPVNILIESSEINKKATELMEMVPVIRSPTMGPPPYCAENDVMYEPLDMNMSVTNITAKTVVDCMIQCRNAPDCGYFSFFFPAKTCHFSSPMATKATGRIGFIGGGATCGPSSPQGKAMVGMKQESVDSKFATQECGVRGLAFMPANGQGRRSSYPPTSLDCEAECQNLTWCHSFQYNTLTKACDLQDWRSKPILGSMYDMAGPVFCSVDVYMNFTAKYDGKPGETRPDHNLLKAALKAGLAMASGRYPVYTEEKTNFFASDGNGRDPEFYKPMINMDEIFLTTRGEDRDTVNMSAILAVPGRRALYLHQLIKSGGEDGARRKLFEAMRNLTVKMEQQLHVNLPLFQITSQRLEIVGDTWRKKMMAMADKELNLTEWVPDQIGAYDAKTAPVEMGAVGRGWLHQGPWQLGFGGLLVASMMVSFAFGRRRSGHYSRVASSRGSDSLLSDDETGNRETA